MRTTSKTYRIKRTGDDFTQVIAEGLDKQEAYARLLEMFNKLTGNECPNWGVAVQKTSSRIYGAFHTMPDGTRMFTDDGYMYLAESEEPKGYLYDMNGNQYAKEENL